MKFAVMNQSNGRDRGGLFFASSCAISDGLIVITIVSDRRRVVFSYRDHRSTRVWGLRARISCVLDCRSASISKDRDLGYRAALPVMPNCRTSNLEMLLCNLRAEWLPAIFRPLVFLKHCKIRDQEFFLVTLGVHCGAIRHHWNTCL